MLYIPVPAEWKQVGDITTVTRYDFKRTYIYNMPSLETLTDDEIALMNEYDKFEVESIQDGEE